MTTRYVNRRCECCAGVAVVPVHRDYARTKYVKCDACRQRCPIGLRRCLVRPILEKEPA